MPDCTLHPEGSEVRPAWDNSQCRLCWRAAFGGASPTPPNATKALPCVHVGQPAGPAGWHVCEHADEPLGMVVCTCKGCGPRCPGYSTAGAAT